MTRKSILLAATSGLFLTTCGTIAFLFLHSTGEAFPIPAGLDPIDFPTGNPYAKAKAELGRTLFFDSRLSSDGTLSCAGCHSPKHAFSEGSSVSVGFHGQRGVRNAPSIINAAYSLDFFWDGRAGTLEDQIVGPVANPIEMASSPAAVVARFDKIAGYHEAFDHAFGTPEITWPRISQAVATFERTLVSGNSPYDRYVAGQKDALDPAQVRGMNLFRDAKCTACHSAPFFTNGAFNNIGVGADKPQPDLGRFAISRDARDWGAFKTPSLRDVERTAPYMHDGSIATLEDVVDFYDRGGVPNRNLDNRIRPLHLSAAQKQDLVAFLKSLNGEGWQTTPPDRFPQ